MVHFEATELAKISTFKVSPYDNINGSENESKRYLVRELVVDVLNKKEDLFKEISLVYDSKLTNKDYERLIRFISSGPISDNHSYFEYYDDTWYVLRGKLEETTILGNKQEVRFFSNNQLVKL